MCKKAEVCILLQAVHLDDCHLELAASNMLANKQEFITIALAKLGHGSQTEAKAAKESSLAFKRLITKVRRPLCVEVPHSAKAKIGHLPKYDMAPCITHDLDYMVSQNGIPYLSALALTQQLPGPADEFAVATVPSLGIGLACFSGRHSMTLLDAGLRCLVGCQA